jgi:hypothetical protein
MRRHYENDKRHNPPLGQRRRRVDQKEDLKPDITEEQVDDEHRHYITEDEVIELLGDIERHREALAHDVGILEHWLGGSAELRAEWSKFIRNGGVTAADFADFMNGQFRYRRIRQHKHLRLVSS